MKLPALTVSSQMLADTAFMDGGDCEYLTKSEYNTGTERPGCEAEEHCKGWGDAPQATHANSLPVGDVSTSPTVIIIYLRSDVYQG
jgi:hypothetical protein